MGLRLIKTIEVPVKGNQQGQNGKARTEVEYIYVFRRPKGRAA
jgi:hypothetical protein